MSAFLNARFSLLNSQGVGVAAGVGAQAVSRTALYVGVLTAGLLGVAHPGVAQSGVAQSGVAQSSITEAQSSSVTTADALRESPVAAASTAAVETVLVQGQQIEGNNILPNRKLRGVYGTETSVVDTPRSITQINAEQLAKDPIFSADDLIKYTPGLTKGGGQNAGIAPIFRAQGSEVFQDGQRGYSVRHPANLNAYEGADIVAGPSSVVFGSATGSGGYINYLSKKPKFEKQQTRISGVLGTWVPNGDSRDGSRISIDTTGPISEDLAYRVSVTRSAGRIITIMSKVTLMPITLHLAGSPVAIFAWIGTSVTTIILTGTSLTVGTAPRKSWWIAASIGLAVLRPLSKMAAPIGHRYLPRVRQTLRCWAGSAAHAMRLRVNTWLSMAVSRRNHPIHKVLPVLCAAGCTTQAWQVTSW